MSKRRADPAFRREVAIRLKQALKEHGLTTAEAAELLGVERQTVWLYLSGKVTPGSEVLARAVQLWDLQLNVKGRIFTKEAFGAPKRTQPRAKQLDLPGALDQIRQDQVDTKVIGRVGEFFELRVRIKAAS